MRLAMVRPWGFDDSPNPDRGEAKKLTWLGPSRVVAEADVFPKICGGEALPPPVVERHELEVKTLNYR